MGSARKGTLPLVVLLGVAVSVLGWLIGFSILTSVLQSRVAAQPVPGTVTLVPTATPPSLTEAPTDSDEAAEDGADTDAESPDDATGDYGQPADDNSIFYEVRSDLSLSPEPKPEHKKLWEMFVTVISKEFAAERIEAFRVYDNYGDGLFAAVLGGVTDGKWVAEFNLTETGDTRELIHTMIHEYGHLLTLNDSQVDGRIGDACPRFRYYDGCAKPESYLNAFHNKFWKKYGVDALDEDNPVDLYETQPVDTFVSDYAATTMLEDMAESWAAFVLRDKPIGATEADAKVRFFYDYPELVKERERIRKAVSGYVR